MPIEHGPDGREAYRIIRIVRAVRGSMPFALRCAPAFDYARQPHHTAVTRAGERFDGPDLSLGLSAAVPLQVEGGAVVAEFRLAEGQELVFALQQVPRGHDVPPVLPAAADELFQATVAYWRRWLSQCQYRGRWRETVHRSALALKLLTFAPTGAIVAAATSSLPEGIGGSRDWDYRFTWIRDAAFTLYAFLRLGFTGEAARFMESAIA